MPYRTVSYSKKGHVATIRLLPVSDLRELTDELAALADRINGDDAVYVVVLTGAGGAFLGLGDGRPGDRPPLGPAAAIAAIDRPVITAINGDAFGEALEMALACDLRLSSDKSRFSLPQVARADIPADGGTQRLPRIVGRGKAMEMLLTSRIISAPEALEIGLVNRVVPAETLVVEARKLAESIAARGPLALRYLKESVDKGLDLTLAQGLRLEADLYYLLHTTADRAEGIKAFREKRKPQFRAK
jgi:enoyl-CoA hydratase/carnithine racemase